MDRKRTEAVLFMIEQRIQDKFDEGSELLLKYGNVKLNEKELWKVNFQMNSLEIDIRYLCNKSNKIKELQNKLNRINIELRSKNNTLSQLQTSKKFYNDLLKQNTNEESDKIFQDCLNDISKNLTNIINEIKNLGIEEVKINKQLNGLCK